MSKHTHTTHVQHTHSPGSLQLEDDVQGLDITDYTS